MIRITANGLTNTISMMISYSFDKRPVFPPSPPQPTKENHIPLSTTMIDLEKSSYLARYVERWP